MHLLVLMAILLLGFKSYGFQYEIENKSLVQSSFLQRYELRQYFAKAGYTSLSDRSLTSAKQPFDSVLTSGHWQKALLIKAGLIAPPNQQEVILEDPASGALAFHFFYDKTPYLILGIHIPRHEFEALLKPWIKKKYSIFSVLMIQPAYATTNCSARNDGMNGIQKTTSFIDTNSLLQNTGRCVYDALQNLTQAPSDVLDFFKRLGTNPQALWQEMKQSYEQIKEFVTNIQVESNKIFASIMGLSAEQKEALVCTLAGSVITQAISRGGIASLPTIFPVLALQLRKISELMSQLSKLEKKGILLFEKNHLTKEVLRCAM